MRKVLGVFLACSTVISALPSLMGMNNNNNGDPTNSSHESLNFKSMTQPSKITIKDIPNIDCFTLMHLGEQHISEPRFIYIFDPMTEELTQKYQKPSDDYLQWFSEVRLDVNGGEIFLIATPNITMPDGARYFKKLNAVWKTGSATNFDVNLLIFSNDGVVRYGINNKGSITIVYRHDDGHYFNCCYVPKAHVSEISQRVENIRRTGRERVQKNIRKWKEKKQLEQQAQAQPTYISTLDLNVFNLQYPGNARNAELKTAQRFFEHCNQQAAADSSSIPHMLTQYNSATSSSSSFYSPQPLQSVPSRSNATPYVTNFSSSSYQRQFRRPEYSSRCTSNNQSQFLDLPSPETMQRFGYLPCLVQEPLDWLTKIISDRFGSDWKALSGYNIMIADALRNFNYSSQNLRSIIGVIQGSMDNVDFIYQNGYCIGEGGICIAVDINNFIKAVSVLLIRQYLVLFSSEANQLIASQSTEVRLSIEPELGEFKVRIAELLTSHASEAQQLFDMRQGLDHGMELMYKLWSISE